MLWFLVRQKYKVWLYPSAKLVALQTPEASSLLPNFPVILPLEFTIWTVKPALGSFNLTGLLEYDWGLPWTSPMASGRGVSNGLAPRTVISHYHMTS